MQRNIDVSPRKAPRQRRSKATVDAILHATARVLVEDGYENANTNRIAQVAGVSIGSLYQYFPSKEALVNALAEQHCERMLGQLAAMATELASEPMPSAVRRYVRAMLAVHAAEPELHRALTTHGLQRASERVRQIEAQARAIVRAYLEQRREQLSVRDLDTASFVLVTAVEAVTHVAVLDQPDKLSSSALEDEICALVLRYLLG